MSVEIRIGDCLSVLSAMPDESVHCVVTSPPYWGLRAYQGGEAMIGLEPTFDEHLANLVAVFREVHRVMRPDATLWLNYGDAYSSGMRSAYASDRKYGQGRAHDLRAPTPPGLKPKDLMMMPARVAMALQADGWYLRSEIIWHKPNPMPESVTDRPTSAHEKVYLLTKSERYFYDAETVREKGSGLTGGGGDRREHPTEDRGIKAYQAKIRDGQAAGANLRNVWTIATSPFSEAHFATFPPALVEPCIKAGTSEHGVCGECGAPWGRVVEKRADGKVRQRAKAGLGVKTSRESHGLEAVGGTFQEGVRYNTTGWTPSCSCDVPVVPATCLDCFGGAGTVGLVADRLQRDAILVEISPEYAEMARNRIHGDAPLFAEVASR